MRLLEPSQAEPVVPPPLGYPSFAEERLLRDLAERLAAVVVAALQGSRLQGAAQQAGRVLDEESAVGDGVVEATWQQGAWRLRLSVDAAEVLLAAQLGQRELSAHALTDLDLRLLAGPVRRMAEGVGRQLLDRDLRSEVRLSRSIQPLPSGPCVSWSFTVTLGGRQGEFVLLTPWQNLRALLGAEPDDSVMEPGMLREAPVVVEALMTAPPLTPRDLLGLQPGDIVRLGALDRPSVLAANGVPFATGPVGARGMAMAVNIQTIEPLQEA
jgi:hypothetical protein